MIGDLVLFAEENTSNSKSYTPTSTAYLAIGRTESALLVLLQNYAQTKWGHAPYFLMHKRTYANKREKTRFITALLPPKDVPSLLKDS